MTQPSAMPHETPPALAPDAASLYERLHDLEIRLPEVVFASGTAANDAIGLDVGGHSGSYRPVIERLGLPRVVTIEPQSAPLAEGVAAGRISPLDAFNGTLQEWAAQPAAPLAAATFIFNMMPGLSHDASFARAVQASTRVGGLVLATFWEAPTALAFHDMVTGHGHGLEIVLDPGAGPARPPSWAQRHRFIQLYRRVADEG